MITTAQIPDVLDGHVVGQDGDKIGKVEQVYLDDVTGEPSWVTVKTGLFGSGESFVPLDAATVDGQNVRVPYDKHKVKDAPRIEDAQQSLSPLEEDELYAYYGITGTSGLTGTTSGTTGTTAGTTSGTTTTGTDGFATSERTSASTGRDRDDDASVVLSEEEVHVGTRKRESGRVRLRKYVVTEQVTKTVPVQREEVRIEREPISEADGVVVEDFGDDEAVVTLHEDEVVVDKEARAVERVRLGTETVTDQQTVTEEVRKEHVDTDVDGDIDRH